MEITRGLVVRALAGRDMGGFFVVLSVDGGYAEIADGKRRRLASPKRKNLRHLQRTNQCIALDGVTDKKLRNLLKQYQASEQCLICTEDTHWGGYQFVNAGCH